MVTRQNITRLGYGNLALGLIVLQYERKKGKTVKMYSHSKRWYYTTGTVTPCDIMNRGGHVKDAVITRVGYANDSVRVTCECGGEWTALTYAKPKNKRK